MELNRYGLITTASIENAKQIKLKQREDESERLTLTKARNNQRVRVGQVAVIGSKKWLRVNPNDFNGSFWIAVEGK